VGVGHIRIDLTLVRIQTYEHTHTERERERESDTKDAVLVGLEFAIGTQGRVLTGLIPERDPAEGWLPLPSAEPAGTRRGTSTNSDTGTSTYRDIHRHW
jgi:hypothetical protein